MKALRNTAWLIFALSVLGAFAILSMPYYRHFALLNLLEGYWMLLLFFVALLMLVLLNVRRFLLARKAGKKGVLPVIGAVLFLVMSAVPGMYALRPLHTEYHLEQTGYRSPDGKHILYRSTHTDFIYGTDYYVYGMYGSGLRYKELFDDDSDEEPDIEWGEDALTYSGNPYPYPQ